MPLNSQMLFHRDQDSLKAFESFSSNAAIFDCLLNCTPWLPVMTAIAKLTFSGVILQLLESIENVVCTNMSQAEFSNPWRINKVKISEMEKARRCGGTATAWRAARASPASTGTSCPRTGRKRRSCGGCYSTAITYQALLDHYSKLLS